MAYDVGDTATLTLTVSPADGTTVATATATNPAGVTAPLSVTSNAGLDTWTAYLPITALGAYRVTWTVTGTGEGVEHDTVYALGNEGPPVGESYATLAELADYLHDVPPGGAAKLLVRASRRIDSVLIGAYYATDTNGLPTDATVVAALRDAVCAQVEWWDEVGDTTGTGAGGAWSTVSIGKVSLGAGSGGDAPPSKARVSPAVYEILQVAGLHPLSPYMVG